MKSVQKLTRSTMKLLPEIWNSTIRLAFFNERITMELMFLWFHRFIWIEIIDQFVLRAIQMRWFSCTNLREFLWIRRTTSAHSEEMVCPFPTIPSTFRPSFRDQDHSRTIHKIRQDGVQGIYETLIVAFNVVFRRPRGK